MTLYFIFLATLLQISSLLAETIIVEAKKNTQATHEQIVISKEEFLSVYHGQWEYVFKSIPGLNTTQSGGLGQYTSVSLRGAASEKTLILVDGMSINDPSSPARSADLNELSALSIEKITITMGPTTSPYGSKALAGIIEITTDKEMGKKLTLRLGPYGERKLALHTSVTKIMKHTINVQHVAADGPSANRNGTEEDGFKKNHADYQGVLYSKYGTWTANMKLNESITELDNGSGKNDDDPNYIKTEINHGESIQWTDNRDRTQVNFTHQEFSKKFHNLSDSSHPFTYHDHYKSQENNESINTRFYESDSLKLNADLSAHQEEFKAYDIPSSHLDVFELGASANYVLDTWALNTQVQNTTFDRTNSQTYMLQLKKNFDYFMTTASRKTSLNIPSLYQLYLSDNDLEVENSTSEEIEFSTYDYELLNLNWRMSANYFQTNMKHLIDYDLNTNKYVNVKVGSQKGVECSLFTQHANWTQQLHVAYLSARDHQGNPLLRRSAQTYKWITNYQWNENLSLLLMGTWMSKRTDTKPDHSSEYITLPALMNWDLSVEKKWATSTVSISLNNIFNNTQEQIAGYTHVGRVVQLGISETF
jgi:vitamin B12 transporter